jgi:hypothetical protein
LDATRTQAGTSTSLEEREEYILPVKIDDTEIPGINRTVGYVDVRTKSMDEIAELLLAKLRLKGQ